MLRIGSERVVTSALTDAGHLAVIARAEDATADVIPTVFQLWETTFSTLQAETPLSGAMADATATVCGTAASCRASAQVRLVIRVACA